MYLIDAFDNLTNENKEIQLHLSENYNFYYDEKKTFENALKHEFNSYHQRLCFHAYVRFLIYNKNEIKDINQWMRVIHNLSHPENRIIDSASDVASAIESIEKLLPYSNDIIEYLNNDNNDITFFNS